MCGLGKSTNSVEEDENMCMFRLNMWDNLSPMSPPVELEFLTCIKGDGNETAPGNSAMNEYNI